MLIVLTFSFLWVTYQGSKLGEDYLAVNTILMQFIILAAFFLDAYAFSTEGIVGYSIGRRNKTSFLQVVKNSIQLSLFTALIISILYLKALMYVNQSDQQKIQNYYLKPPKPNEYPFHKK